MWNKCIRFKKNWHMILFGGMIVGGVGKFEAKKAWALQETAQQRNAETKSGKAAKEKEIISFVLLLKKPKTFEKNQVGEIAARAWKLDPKEISVAVGPTQGALRSFKLRAKDRTYLLVYASEPYGRPQEQVKKGRDRRLSTALAEHRGWVSADVFGDIPVTEKAEAYQAIGRLAAELMDENCLIVYSTETKGINVYDPALRDKLRSADPLTAFEEVSKIPVVGVEDDDAEMAAAVAEARRRWPEFVKAFQGRKAGQHFSIKAPVTDGKETEYMWISVREISGQQIKGVLDNEPHQVTGVKVGDVMTVAADDLNDWLIGEDRKLVAGGFTIEVLKKRSEK